MTDEGGVGQDSGRDQRTIPAITDWACCSLASLGAVVALMVVVVLVTWHPRSGNAAARAITNRRRSGVVG
jgi:hypothetical protein